MFNSIKRAVKTCSAYKTRKKKWELPFKKEFDAPIPGHQTLYILESILYLREIESKEKNYEESIK